LDAGATPSSPDIHGGYPIHYASQMCGANSEMGNDTKVGLKILKTLLARGVDVNVVDEDGRQPILWAASAGKSLVNITYGCQSKQRNRFLSLTKKISLQ
jgi:ankyrin repeat protein